MEQLDIFDKHGTRTGEILVRGQDELQPGQRILVVHIWVINSKGELLIQRRADHLKAWPGRWTTTGGAVSSGEDSHLSACRELAEELGVTAPIEEIAHFAPVDGVHYEQIRLYRARWDAKIRIQAAEVEDKAGQVDYVLPELPWYAAMISKARGSLGATPRPFCHITATRNCASILPPSASGDSSCIAWPKLLVSNAAIPLASSISGSFIGVLQKAELFGRE